MKATRRQLIRAGVSIVVLTLTIGAIGFAIFAYSASHPVLG
jgi:hypothetical protein